MHPYRQQYIMNGMQDPTQADPPPEEITVNITPRAIVTLLTFVLANAMIVRPITVPLPLAFSRAWATLQARRRGSRRRTEERDAAGTNINMPNAVEQPPQQPPPTPTNIADAVADAEAGLSTVSAVEISDGSGSNGSNGKEPERWRLELGLKTVSVCAVIFLLATTCIDFDVVRRGIAGREGGLRPFDVMSLFISFAYLSISLDHTGLFRYLAFVVAERYASSGASLYVAFYLFFAASGCLLGNDPLILSGTPFLAYFTRHAGIAHPWAYLFSHFQVSNLVSALLVSSNPTNLVITSGFGISFLKFSAWTSLPVLGSLIVLYPVLRGYVFGGRRGRVGEDGKNMIPKVLSPPRVNARKALVDPQGGIFGAVIFFCVVAVLLTLSAMDKLDRGVVGVWCITVPAALLMFTRDMIYDYRRRPVRLPQPPPLPPRPNANLTPGDEQSAAASALAQRARVQARGRAVQNGDGGHLPQQHHIDAANNSEEDEGIAVHPVDPNPPTTRPLSWFAAAFPTTWVTLRHLPIALVLFGFSMFIIMEALLHTGWIALFAGWWADWVSLTGIPGGVALIAVLTVLFCNVCGTNIGATVLLVHILQQWRDYHGPVTDRQLYSALYTMTIGSSFGAYSFAFPASLAGLLWRNILNQKGITVTQRQFLKYNWLPIIVTMTVGSLIVTAEVLVIYRD